MAKIKDEYECSLVLTFDLLGGKWKLRILWHIIHGDNRFSLLLKGIPDISEKMLTTQLRELEKSHILERTVVCEKPLNIEYGLSTDYAHLEDLIDRLCDFTKGYAKDHKITIKE